MGTLCAPLPLGYFSVSYYTFLYQKMDTLESTIQSVPCKKLTNPPPYHPPTPTCDGLSSAVSTPIIVGQWPKAQFEALTTTLKSHWFLRRSQLQDSGTQLLKCFLKLRMRATFETKIQNTCFGTPDSIHLSKMILNSNKQITIKTWVSNTEQYVFTIWKRFLPVKHFQKEQKLSFRRRANRAATRREEFLWRVRQAEPQADLA